jgi:hypothetical protein
MRRIVQLPAKETAIDDASSILLGRTINSAKSALTKWVERPDAFQRARLFATLRTFFFARGKALLDRFTFAATKVTFCLGRFFRPLSCSLANKGAMLPRNCLIDSFVSG